jgi:hypothetical protein
MGGRPLTLTARPGSASQRATAYIRGNPQIGKDSSLVERKVKLS